MAALLAGAPPLLWSRQFCPLPACGEGALSFIMLVIPAKAGIHISACHAARTMDSRFRGNDYDCGQGWSVLFPLPRRSPSIV
jgi:hypothetical protein